MSALGDLARRHAKRVAAVAIAVPLYFAARPPALAPEERAAMAGRFRFERREMPKVSDRAPRSTRPVHPSLAHIAGWINVLGAGVALDDLDRDGLPNDVVWVDPRFDQVFVAPAPGTGERYAPFALDPAPLAYDERTTAPMGCVPCDMNEDGLPDLLVYYWGRAPIAFLCREEPGRSRPLALCARSYTPCAIGEAGERWYTNAATFADLDGDGHADLVIGNYFQDGARILDESAAGSEEMHESMSRAFNGGRNRLLRWSGANAGTEPSVRFVEVEWGLPHEIACAWTLAAGAADLDGDLLPEIYFANDFGPDRLLHNRSIPGRFEFAELEGVKTFTMPNSKVLGRDSFKGMGVDFGDLNGDGLLDIVVSDITTEFGLEESQLAWISTGETARMKDGIAPYVDESESLGLSRSGWAWDVKLADFDCDGVLEVVQALGFMKGEVGRWPELHEVAMGNDQLLEHPGSWHDFLPGDDLSGHTPNPFFVRARSGRYFDLCRDVGLGEPQISRGVAIADVDGDGDLDFALGNQWEPSAFYTNVSPRGGAFLGLHLLLPVGPGETGETVVRDGHPRPELLARAAIGAQACVRLPDGRRLVAQVDGGNGHSGKRSHDLHFGLGRIAEGTALPVELVWRDPIGRPHRKSIAMTPGWHTLVLGSREEDR